MAVVFIDIESPAGTKQGKGPIESAAMWEYTPRMDRAGVFRFEMPASDPKAISIRKKYIARAYANLNGQRVEVGAGVIDRIDKQPQPDGKVILRIGGNDLVGELNNRSVKDLKLYTGGNPVTHATAVAAIEDYAPAGWTFTPDGAPPNDSIYGYFNGETVLAGLIKVADKSYSHFYRGEGRSLVFTSEFTPSGVRAIRARGNLKPATCAIVNLTEQVNTHDLITRIYPRGSGNSNVQLTLKATTRTAPAGYTLNAAENYIEHQASLLEYGLIERQVDFRDIGPIENTNADVVAASNALFDAALETLRRRSVEMTLANYIAQISGCDQMLRPMQSIRLVYRDTPAGLNINDDFNILEPTWRVDHTGIHTIALKVSSSDMYVRSDRATIADSIEQGHVYQALQQLNANSYVLAYTKNVDGEEMAAFRFRFGNEVTQLQQVLFELQLLPFEATVRAVGGASGGSGEIPTSQPNINETGNGGNNETGVGGPTSTDSATPTIGTTTPDIGNATPTIGTTTPTIGTTTPSIGTTTPTIGTTTPTIGTTTPTLGSTGLTTNTPTGGSTDGDGDHIHALNVIAGAGSLGSVDLHFSGGNYFLSNAFVTGSEQVFVTPIGFHTHTVNSHTHTIDPHTHTMNGHTHSLPGHTHSLPGHTHTIAGHTHTMTAHTHTIAAHNHTIAAHTHTMTSHTHSLAQHTHSLNNHTHDLSDSITALYGIHREDEDRTYEIDELEYRVNGGSWIDLSGAEDAGDGWYAVDITAAVQDATTFRPLQENNMVEVRAKQDATIALEAWQNGTTHMAFVTVAAHGLQVNDRIDVVGAAVGTAFGSDINGTYTVRTVEDTDIFTALPAVGTSGDANLASGGAIRLHKTATIDAQLSVRNIIQAVIYA